MNSVVYMHPKEYYSAKKKEWDFPGGSVVKRICPHKCRAHRFDSWSGKMPHATGQLSL